MSKWKKKAKQQTGEGIDFDYIAKQVKTGQAEVTISGLVDFGCQDSGYYLDEKGVTFFDTEEEVHEFLDFIENEPSMGERAIEEHDLAEYEEEDEVYKLPFKIVKNKWVFMEGEKPENVSYQPTAKKAQKELDKAIKILEGQAKTAKGTRKKFVLKDLEALKGFEIEAMEDVFKVNCSVKKMDDEFEVGVWVDVTNNRVEYIEGDEDSVRQYRIPLNPPFKKLVRGFRLTQDSDDLFSSKALVDLLKSCGLESVVTEGDEDEGNLGLLAGASFQTEVVGNNGFFRTKGRLPVKEGTEIEPLDNDPVVINFDDDPEEIAAGIKAFYLQQAYKDKIKSAKNYEGSNMEKAFAILEGDSDGADVPSDGDEQDPVGQDAQEEKDAPASTEEATEAPKKAKKAPTKKAAKKKEPEPEEEDFDDDLPFAPIGLMYDNLLHHVL